MKKILFTLASVLLLFTSCKNMDVLDREPLDSFVDNAQFWQSDGNLRLYANSFYMDGNSYALFYGYSRSWNANFVPIRSNYVSDDFATSGTQPAFPTTNTGSTSFYIGGTWPGRGWNFTFVRRINVMFNRLKLYSKSALPEESYNHWMGICRFFRAMEYAELVRTYGDVPWFGDELKESDTLNMYKDRTPRADVMDSVYVDLKYAISNVRTSDGDNKTICNRYAVAAYASRIMLWEGTWQYYHNNNTTLAKKYLEFAAEAAKYVMDSGKYSIATSFHDLFGSQDLSSNKECILYRHYDAAQGITHCIASYSNGDESQDGGANLSLLKAFICNDGKVYENSSSFTSAGITLANDGEKFALSNMFSTRDPRFESTFYYKYRPGSPTLIYCNKFIDRLGTENSHQNNSSIYTSVTNTNDAPEMRLGEVLLNYIEARAELAVNLGGTAVTQAEIDATINKLRDRPLDAVAISRGVKATAHMVLTDITASFDPERDKTVPPLIWEVRRERRMELIGEEPTRLYDLKRWKKLDYMTSSVNFNDIMVGSWVNYSSTTDSCDDMGLLAARSKSASYKGLIGVRKLDGTIVKFNGTNAAQMVGFNLTYNGKVRTQEPEDRDYLAPVPLSQVDFYKSKGHTLTQNPGW